MKPLFIISSFAALIVLWDIVPAVQAYAEAEPIGSTGCSKKWTQENGRCWRYCSGSDGDWCYTGTGNCMGNCYIGSQEESCADKTTCRASYGCAGAAEGCVTACQARNSSSTQNPRPRVPHGSTGCSKKWVSENGRCWRYCSGSSGKWCYTRSQCFGDEEACASRTACSATSSGCVRSCEPEVDVNAEEEQKCNTLRRSIVDSEFELELQHFIKQQEGTGTTKDKDSSSFRGTGCSELRAQYEREYESVSIEEPFPKALPTPSILKYWYRKGSPRPTGDRIPIPTMVHAIVTRKCKGWRSSIKNFGVGGGDDGDREGFEENMNAMDRRSNDEKGRLIGAKLCAPRLWYNLAPMTPGLQSTAMGQTGSFGWSALENNFARYVDAGCGNLELWTIIEYRHPQDGDGEQPKPSFGDAYRPLGFKVCAKVMDRNGTHAGRELVYYFDNERWDEFDKVEKPAEESAKPKLVRS